MKTFKAGNPLRRIFSSLTVAATIFSATGQTVQTNLAVTVQHAPSLNGGTIQGSLQQLNGESVNGNSGLTMTGDLLVPGTPNIVLNGKPTYSGTVPGSGSTSPTGYQVTLNSGSSLRYLRTRTAPVTISGVPVPPPPTGTRSVTLNTAGQSYGDATTLRNLTLNSNVGLIPVPPGNYGNFIVNGGSGLVIGVAGGLQPVTYNLQSLNLNGSSTLKIAGPVVLTLASGFNGNGMVGDSNNPAWLQLQFASGGLTLNSGCTVYGLVLAPNGAVIVNGNSKLLGTSASAQFTLNSGGLVSWSGASSQTNQPPVAMAQTLFLPENGTTNITLTGSDPQGKPLAFTVLTQPAHGTLSGTPPGVTYKPATNFFGSDAFTFKVNNGVTDSSTATVSVTITQVYYPPTAIARALTNFENATLPVTLTGSDPQGYALSFSVLTLPAHGSLSGTAPNLTYQPAMNYYGSDSFTFRVNNGVSNSLPAIVSITNQPVDYPPLVVAGPSQLIIFPANTVYLSGSASFASFPGTVNTVAWSKVSGPGQVVFSNPSNAVTSATFSQPGVYQIRLLASDSFLSSSNDLLVTVDAPPVVSTISAMTNTFPGTVTLTGNVSDDGLPTNGTLTVSWSKISGPGTVIFGNAGATNTTVTFSTNGVYILRFSADDSIATNHSDLMTIENLPPVVNAGPTQIVNFGTTIILAGTATDDQLPDNTLTSYWSKVSGPGTASFANASLTNTTVTFDQPGIYTLSLTTSDGFATNSSNATLIVNQPPAVSVLADNVKVQLPATVTLTGIITDDGLPNGTLSNNWSQVNGPSKVVFSNPSGTNTSATFSQAGIYILRLTADDTMASGNGEISVNVLPASAINHPPQAIGQSLETGEDEPLAITLSGTDPDGDALAFTVIIPPAHGTLSGSSSNLIYLPETGYSGDDAFVFVATDGQADSGPAMVYLAINPLNYPPVISVPAGQTVTQNPILQFDMFNSVSFFDPDAGNDLLQLTLSAAHGTLMLGATNGLLWVAGSNSSSNIVVKGSMDDLNNSLAELTYIGAIDFVGSDALEISVDDLGHGGSVGSKSDSKSIAITIQPAVHLSKSATSGTNFWVSRLSGAFLPGIGSTRMRWIMMLAERDTSVTITAPNKTTLFYDSGTFSRAPGGVSTIILHAGVPYLGSLNLLNRFAPAIASDSVTNFAFQISSAEPISVFVTDFSQNQSDAFRALPDASLGTNYVITSYPNFMLFPGSVFGSQFSVTAVESNTVVTIVPAVTTSGHVAGQPYSLTLQKGATYSLRHTETATGDLTGTTVNSDKPIAVLGGNAYATIPPNQGSPSDISEQLLPVEHWDSEYVVARLAGHASYAVRVLASRDGTGVQIPGLGETNLARGQYWDLFPTNDLQIIASQPVAVCQYALGSLADALPGAPTMFWVPGVHQGLTDCQWMTPEAVHTLNFGQIFAFAPLYTNFINIVAPTTAFESLRINNDPLPSDALWNLVGNGQYRKVTLPVTNGVYVIHCSEPVVTVSYGFFENAASYGAGSYGLPGSFSLPVFPLNVQVNVASPTNGSVVIAGVGTPVIADLSDPQHLVTNVEFRVDGTKISEGTATNLVWTPAQSGSFALQLVAATSTGQSVTSAPVNVTASYDFVSQGVFIVSPYDDESVYVNNETLISLDFEDPLGVFDHAEFFANNVSLGQTTNTSFIWVPSLTNDYDLKATIYDLFGVAYNTTNLVTVRAITPPRPVVTITSPGNGNRLRAGAVSYLIASLDDPGQLTTNLQFYVDGVKISDNTSYYSWTPTLLGSHALQAVALTSDGDSTASPIINVIVATMFPPVVNILSPTNGQMFASGTVPVVNAQATGSDALITNLTLTLDGNIFGQTNGVALAVVSTNLASGWHQAVAQASDNNGLSASSTVVSFFVERGENQALPVPDHFAATALSATEIQLTWSPIATNDLTQKILVQRWDPVNSLWTEIANVPVASADYLDSALDPETNYRYRIAGADAGGNRSAYTAETNATTRTVVPNYAAIDLTASVSSSLTNLVPGGNSLTHSGLSQFDLRRTVPLGTRHAQSVLGVNATTLGQAVARFKEQWPQIQLDLDPVLLSPHSILPRVGYLTGPDGSGVTVRAATAQLFDPADPYRPVKAFVQEYQSLFGFGSEEIMNAAVLRDYVTPANGAHTVVWQQQVIGIPVFNALFNGHITAAGELAAVACDFIPHPEQAVDPAELAAALNGYTLPLAGSQALQIAANNVGDVFAVSDIISQSAAQGMIRSQSYVAAKGIKGVAYVGLTWFPESRNQLKLAWQVIFTSQWRNEMYLTLISVEDNAILYRRNLTADSSEASYRVYTDSSPMPMLPGWPTPNNAQPPLVDRSLVTLTAVDTNASPNGWINDGENQTLGNNVDAHLDRNDDNLPDLPRPIGNPSRVFDFGLDLGFDPFYYGDASVVQLFYFDNWMHDVLYGLGFTEAAGNFQAANLGRGGVGGDAVQAAAQDGLSLNDSQHRNRASMSTPPDGFSPLMKISVFDGANPGRDGSLDTELVLHEYTHGLSARLVGGGAGIDAQQTAGLGEGWSDFFALALAADPAADPDAAYPVGSYLAYHGYGTMFDQNYYYGIRHYPYCTDTNKNPLTFADIDPDQASAHAGVPCSPLTGPFDPSRAGEVHSLGEVWCVMLWEMRASLIRTLGAEAGNQRALQLVTDGMRFSPPNPNFVQARDAILLADRILANDADAPVIWAAFAKRGLGYDATAPYAYTTAGGQSSYATAPALVVERVTVQGGDGSGRIATNGNSSLLIVVHNRGTGMATQVSATITTTTPGVQIIQSQSAYNDIPQGESRANLVQLQIQMSPEFVPGTPVDLNVTINSASQLVTSSQRYYTGNSGASLPGSNNSSAAPTSGSALPPDLTPWNLGNLEPLWMADDASCLLKAGPGKYILWRPGADPIPMTNPNFLAHRLTRQGVVVGELATDLMSDQFGNRFTNTVGALWVPGQPAPVPLTGGVYSYPKGSQPGQNVGLAYAIDHAASQLVYLGGVGNFPMLSSLWDMNTNGQSAGAASVYLRPPDLNSDGYISTNEVLRVPLEKSFYYANGNLQSMLSDERNFSASNNVPSAARQVNYNALLTSAARFNLNSDWNWLGPLNFSGGSVFSVGLLINDRGDVAGTGATYTGNPTIDPLIPTRVFRWNVGDGEFTLGTPVVEQLGVLAGGQHAFPLAMNQAGDIAGYSETNSSNPGLLHAAFWGATVSTASDLGTLGGASASSQAFSINDQQQIVGFSQKTNGSPAAVLWQFNHNTNNLGTGFWETTDLNDRLTDPSWDIFNAVGVNNDGLILAQAADANGAKHAVLLMQITMAVDNNRDGQISFDSQDQTTVAKPYRFWINNDHDGFGDEAGVQDDLQPGTVKDSDSPTISCTRNLEDFTRLWINTQSLITKLKNGTCFLGLHWEVTSGEPEIKLFRAVETDGGSQYLADPNMAQQQIDPQTFGTRMLDEFGVSSIRADNRNVPFIIPLSFWANVPASAPVAHFLFEGVNRGSGKLVASVYKSDRVTKIADGPAIYLKLQDVKEMYERWTVDPATSENSNGKAPTTTARISTARGLSGFQYNSFSPEEKQYILFVHGWNMKDWDKDWFAETAFKRLYWQGYKGRFGAFQWPTGFGISDQMSAVLHARNYDNSELVAWQSATGLLNLLTSRLNPDYTGHVYMIAHSMGNVVAGEALKLAGSTPVVNTYIAAQAAIPAHAYDPTCPTHSFDFLGRNRDSGTPNRYAQYPTDNATNYFNGVSGALTCVNFYNVNDFALSKWILDQDLKPDQGVAFPGYYYDQPPTSRPTGFYKIVGTGRSHDLLFPADRYEIFAYGDEARSFALGATARVTGFTPQNLPDLWLPDNSTNDPDKKYAAHSWHSAEFRFSNMEQKLYWREVMVQFGLPTNP